MIVGSIKENLTIEKRVSITPETAKNIINLGLKVFIENDYATHIGITDKEYETVGVQIKSSSKEVLNNCNLLTKVNCPSDEEIFNLKNKTILVGMLNPSKNQSKINNILKKNINIFSLELLPRISRAQSMDVLSSQSNLAGYRSVIDSIYEFSKVNPNPAAAQPE
jgi:NAD(P) transhydrogenase subunit alpha